MKPETDPATLKLVADATAGLSREKPARLLDDIRSHVDRFIGFGSEHASVAVALWTAHCYAIDSAPMAAYLRVRSAAEESGKSTLLEIEQQLLRAHGINAVSVSPSVGTGCGRRSARWPCCWTRRTTRSPNGRTTPRVTSSRS